MTDQWLHAVWSQIKICKIVEDTQWLDLLSSVDDVAGSLKLFIAAIIAFFVLSLASGHGNC